MKRGILADALFALAESSGMEVGELLQDGAVEMSAEVEALAAVLDVDAEALAALVADDDEEEMEDRQDDEDEEEEQRQDDDEEEEHRSIRTWWDASGVSGVRASRGPRLASLLDDLVESRMESQDIDRATVVSQMGSAAGIDASTVNQILAGDIDCPPLRRLEGFAEYFNVGRMRIIDAAVSDGCNYNLGDDDDGDRAVRSRRAPRFFAPVGDRAFEDRGFEAKRRALDIPTGIDRERTSEFIASTSGEARDGDILDQSSWRLGEFRSNPVILDNHDLRNVVGRAVAVDVVDGALRAAVLWDDSPKNPDGERVAHQHRTGMRRAVSVRWHSDKRTPRNDLPKDHPAFHEGSRVSGLFGDFLRVGEFLQGNTLLEISSVSVPADPAALQVRFARQEARQHPDRARSILSQVPDPGLRSELLGRFDVGELVGSDAFQTHFRRLLIETARNDRDFQRVVRAMSLGLPSTVSTPRSAVSAVDTWLSAAFEES